MMSALATIRPPLIKQHPKNNEAQVNAKIVALPKIRISEQLYWQDYYEVGDKNYEWNNGYLEEKPVSEYATVSIYNWLVKLLSCYFETHHNGTMVNLEMGFRLNLPQKVTIRKPDLGVIYHTNPVQLSATNYTYQGIFDLCIEALSDSHKKEILRDTITKKQEYAQAGVKEYFIVYAKDNNANKYMNFYQLNQGVYQPINRTQGGLIQSQVLPGFQFRINDLYQQPEMQQMCLDPVYQDFVFPVYQSEKKRAEVAEQIAQSEKKRAKVAEQVAQSEKKRAEVAEQELIKLRKILSQQQGL